MASTANPSDLSRWDTLVCLLAAAVGLVPYALFIGILFFIAAHGCPPWSRPGWALLWSNIVGAGCR